MKIHACMTMLAAGLFACGGDDGHRSDGGNTAGESAASGVPSASDLKTIVMTVPSMSCPLCVRSIRARLEEAGLKDIRIDLDTKLVRARFDPARITPSEVEALVAGQGFPVEARIVEEEPGDGEGP